MEKEYLSIKAFAERVGVSTQAVYKRLNKVDNPLQEYVIVVDGQKRLDIAAISLFEPEPENEADATSLQPVGNQLQTEYIEFLKAEILKRDSQLDKKDEQIANLQQLLSQEQQLHALAEQRILMLESGSTQAAEAVTPEEAQPEPEAEQQPKKKWWQWWK